MTSIANYESFKAENDKYAETFGSKAKLGILPTKQLIIGESLQFVPCETDWTLALSQ